METRDNRTAAPIGIIQPTPTAAPGPSATGRSQVLGVTSNTTGTTISPRATGAATVTMMAEAETDIMTTGAATVATRIIDGGGTDAY